jgi:ATP-binding cassette subfamily B protein
LDNLVRGRTTIAIAHRLSTLRKADRLVVMDKGQIVEVGPHDDLIAAQGAYWRLYEAQQRQAQAEGAIFRESPIVEVVPLSVPVAVHHTAKDIL